MCPEGAYAHTPAHIINAHSTSHLCNTLTLNINNILLGSVLICFIFVTVSKRCFRKMLFIFHCVSVQIFRLFSMSLSFSMNSLNEWQRRRRRYGGRRMREEESGGFCQPEINKAGTLLLLRLLCLSFSCPPCPPSLVFFLQGYIHGLVMSSLFLSFCFSSFAIMRVLNETPCVFVHAVTVSVNLM